MEAPPLNMSPDKNDVDFKVEDEKKGTRKNVLNRASTPGRARVSVTTPRLSKKGGGDDDDVVMEDVSGTSKINGKYWIS